MNRRCACFLASIALACVALGPFDSAHAYALSDLLGTWRAHGIASGPGAPWWERAHLQISDHGDFTGSSLTNLGEMDTIQSTLDLSPTGILSISGSSTFRGALDIGRSVFTITDTWDDWSAGTTELKVALKTVGAYTSADLAGDWELHSIASGPGAPWWLRGRLAVGSDGSFTGTLAELGGAPEPASGSFAVAPDGVLSLSVASLARGALDAGRTVMALTNTWTGFMAGTTELSVGVKVASNYVQSDLAGTWELNSLATGPGAPWWNRGTLNIAANGSYTGTTTESNGSTQPTSGTITLASNGVLTRAGSPTSRGALDAGRSVMVWTDTWTTGSPGTSEILLAVRTGGSTTAVEGDGRPELSLDPVHPNPVRGGATRVRFRLPGEGDARLELFDLHGRVVLSREVGRLGTGSHEVTFGERTNLLPGLYWLRLSHGGQTRARRVAVL